MNAGTPTSRFLWKPIYCVFTRVTRRGKYHLKWDAPSKRRMELTVHVDFYNVYQRNGSVWGFIGSTNSTEIYIDNVQADIERGIYKFFDRALWPVTSKRKDITAMPWQLEGLCV